jgi:hypothetical protein
MSPYVGVGIGQMHNAPMIDCRPARAHARAKSPCDNFAHQQHRAREIDENGRPSLSALCGDDCRQKKVWTTGNSVLAPSSLVLVRGRVAHLMRLSYYCTAQISFLHFAS